MILRLAETSLRTKFGVFREILYYDGQQESFALVLGDLSGQADVLCRVHSSCIHAHHFNSIECDCREQMELAQQLIQQAGRGLIIWLEQEGKSNGHFALLKSKEYKSQGMPQDQAYEAVGFSKDARDFRPAAEIIRDLGIRSIVMLTNNVRKTDTLSRHGIVSAGTRALEMD